MFLVIGHKMVMVHFYRTILNIDDVRLKLYTHNFLKMYSHLSLLGALYVHMPKPRKTFSNANDMQN